MAQELSIKDSTGSVTGLGQLENRVSSLKAKVIKLQDDCTGKAAESQKETAEQFLKLLADFKIFLKVTQNTVNKIEREFRETDAKQQSSIERMHDGKAR